MKIKILDRAKKKKIMQELEPLGIKNTHALLIKVGKERIKAFEGSLSTEEIYDLWRIVPIEGIGLYYVKEIVDKKTGKKEVRLSLDGAHMHKDEIKNRIVILNESQEEEWFRGKNINLETSQQEALDIDKCFVIIKSEESGDIIGTGKIGVEKKILYNYMPKERRRKSQLL